MSNTRWTKEEIENMQKSINTTTPKITESAIQRQIKEYLQWHGWFVVKIHQSLGSYRGIADLYALKNGRHVWIEVKTPTGRLSEDQKKFREDVLAHGGTYIVARAIEDVECICRNDKVFEGQLWD